MTAHEKLKQKLTPLTRLQFQISRKKLLLIQTEWQAKPAEYIANSLQLSKGWRAGDSGLHIFLDSTSRDQLNPTVQLTAEIDSSACPWGAHQSRT
jgi:hypothetical protein